MEPRARAADAARQRDWRTVHDTLAGRTDLGPDEHVLLAQSAHWLGRPEVTISGYRDAYRHAVRALRAVAPDRRGS